MTHPDLGKWTPDTLRVAIAEAIGLQTEKDNSMLWDIHWPNGKTQAPELIPNYPYDLNAIHEAETVLTFEQWDQYSIILYSIAANVPLSKGHFPLDANRAFVLATATALQRSLALARTLNLKPKKRE